MIERRRALRLGAALVVLLLVLLALGVALQPARVTGFVLSSLGDALDLQITARGRSDYTLRGKPMLVVRDVDIRKRGDAAPLLKARRILVSVPWSTVRSRGAQLDITRIELDTPVLDITALQRWLASRPPGESRLPTLSDGLHINDGRIDGNGWRIDDVTLALPRFAADRPLSARIGGRYRGATRFATRFDLSAAATRPGNDAGVAIAGTVVASDSGWRVPARLRAAGLLHVADDDIRIAKLRASLAGRYESTTTPTSAPWPFAVAITSPLRYRDGAVALHPAGLALRGGGVVPELDARGRLAYIAQATPAIEFDVDGRLARWPDGWPALPAPLSASASPLPFAMRYVGAPDLSDPLDIVLRRDATRFDARLRVAEVTAWTAHLDDGSPLPPLSGRLVSPRIDISGAQLEGVVIDFEESPPAASPSTQ